MAEAITPLSFQRKEDFVVNRMKQEQSKIEVALTTGVRKVWLASILFTTIELQMIDRSTQIIKSQWKNQSYVAI